MKQKSDVEGYIIRCPDYVPCPLCYGCRNFSPRYQKCLDHCGTFKEDICNTKKHRDDLINRMLEKQKVEVKE